MSRYFKVHPGVGVARVGKSTAGYFLAPETRDGAPFELSPGAETLFNGYKDASYLIRKQAARFRVYEYDLNDATGALTLVGELTPAQAEVSWSVELGNRKSAGPIMVGDAGPQGERVIVPGPDLRNPSVTGAARAGLSATASANGLTGPDLALVRLDGAIMGRPVLLGEAGTDHLGRLVVTGGPGDADSWVNPLPAIRSYLNNDGWFDGVADGPVDAVLRFPDGSQSEVQEGAWVVVGPPDFAPQIEPFVSLHDVIVDALLTAGRLPAPTTVSFQNDVLPILRRAAGLRWVNSIPEWEFIHVALADLTSLADPGAANAQARRDIYDLLLAGQSSLSDFRLTVTQTTKILDPWAAGSFLSDLGALPPVLTEPEELDRMALAQCIGSGFFPGIEVGFLSSNPDLYSGFARFTRLPFPDRGGMTTLQAGSITERMACPWQADFMECEGSWWPVQRPDTSLFLPDGTPTPAGFRWDRGLVVGNPANPASHLSMVQHFAQLGVVVRKEIGVVTIFVEEGRDPALPV